ncbi:UNVERIFIED_ORG: hypothetical protein J2W85_002128 [Ensifer adhaerens]|nr:hypothetical protein [Ensifer adhaerens]
MSDEATPIGQRFSQVYLQPKELLPDSERARRRMGHIVEEYANLKTFGPLLAKTIGIKLPSNYQFKGYWPGILELMDIRDFLDTVTVLYNALHNQFDLERSRILQERFMRASREVFAEEKIQYRIDNKCGVHFAVDQAFEELRISTIASLSAARYNGVRASYEGAFEALDKTPPDGKAALRAAFFATEGLFRLMFASAHQLSASEVQKHLEPLVNRVYDGQKPAINLAQKLVASLKDWIDGAHFYRHEPGDTEPAQPPLELAIYMLSEAGGHLRWLATLDRLSRN